MTEGTRRSNTLERACLDLLEATVLQAHVGETFSATVIDISDDHPTRGTVHLAAPAVVGRVDSPTPLPLGTTLTVRLTEADPTGPTIRFVPA